MVHFSRSPVPALSDMLPHVFGAVAFLQVVAYCLVSCLIGFKTLQFVYCASLLIACMPWHESAGQACCSLFPWCPQAHCKIWHETNYLQVVLFSLLGFTVQFGNCADCGKLHFDCRLKCCNVASKGSATMLCGTLERWRSDSSVSTVAAACFRSCVHVIGSCSI